MKAILTAFLSIFLMVNFVSAQDTLYVYKSGAVLYKQAVSGVDSVTLSKTYPITGTFSDNDGHIYHYQSIGSQIWMTENLRTSKYRTGESISNLTVNADWTAATFGAWCDYNNDATTYDSKYGKLYNWYAVHDPRNIAPTGWHVATDAEWTTLNNYVTANFGTSLSAAKALASTTDWSTTFVGNPTPVGTIGNNLSINNYTGFCGLPGGSRGNSFGGVGTLGGTGTWWTSTENNSDEGWCSYLSNNSNIVNRQHLSKVIGFSVRCVKD